MNAYSPPVKCGDPFETLARQIDEILSEPEWDISPSPFDWQVLLWGGENPRTGLPQQPLTFQFFGRFYSAKDIEAKAEDLRRRHFRDHVIIREPTDRGFMRARLRPLADRGRGL